MQIPSLTCVCGHTWMPRVPAPQCCPKCHRPLDKQQAKEKLEREKKEKR